MRRFHHRLGSILAAADAAGRCAVLPGQAPALVTTHRHARRVARRAGQRATHTGQPPAAAAAAPPPGSAAPAPPASGLPAFATVVKGARQVDGPIVAWQKEEKLWLELSPEQFGKPFMLSPKLATGIGEAFVIGGLMSYGISGAGGPQLVEFVRVHNTVRLQARNTEVVARPGTPEARAVAASYSPSLLATANVVSQPHPERKTVLIDASTMFLSDMQGVGMRLQRAFRQGYSLDPRNSSVVAVRGSAQSLEIETQNHYYSGSIAVPQPGTPPGVPSPTVPRYVPDSRSLFIGHHYSLAPLPEAPMAPRRADARIGFMTQSVLDYGDDVARSPRVRMIERWRLRRRTRRRRCRSRSSPSPSGSTATCR